MRSSTEQPGAAARRLPAPRHGGGAWTGYLTVFIDRKGRVRKIHTGFSGPATGAHYAEFVAEFRRTIDQLLAES